MTGKKMIRLSWLIALFLGLGMQSANATEFIFGFSIGPTFAKGGNSQTFFLQPQTERTYTADQPQNVLAEGEFFLGLQGNLFSSLFGQLGVAVGATSLATLAGHIWDDADAAFDNFTYQYKIGRSYVGLKGKVLLDFILPVMPYISGSIGVGFNTASQFTNTPTIAQAIAEPNFADKTMGALAYTVGIGIERAITDHVQIGIGYEFEDFGPSSLDRAQGQTLGSGPMTDHFFSHGLLFNISYHR